jgi:hypothetical protein
MRSHNPTPEPGDLNDKPRRGRSKTACIALAGLAALTAAVVLPRDVHADDIQPSVQWVGACAFSPALGAPPLQATFSPNLTSLSGSGECAGNAGIEQITLLFNGGAGISCVGGVETMGGQVVFNGSAPSNQSGVTVIAVGGPGFVHLVILGSNFNASADFAWPDLGCPGSFTTAVSGALEYESA